MFFIVAFFVCAILTIIMGIAVVLVVQHAKREIKEKFAYEERVASTARSLKDCEEELRSLREDYLKLRQDYVKSQGQNKSIEVRTGQIMEKMAPFMEVFNHDPKTAQFLGQPIDYVVFGEDEIVFVEVKTGGAKPTQKQNKIKKLVESGKVRFEIVRFKP